ncbi:hypothetical protein JCM33374_g4495 [Metschnikowia sp. JCM 33374]|nr:hypothetical protein JCM33374_g4495 [Metschnikowia sp. JCM 33374]
MKICPGLYTTLLCGLLVGSIKANSLAQETVPGSTSKETFLPSAKEVEKEKLTIKKHSFAISRQFNDPSNQEKIRKHINLRRSKDAQDFLVQFMRQLQAFVSISAFDVEKFELRIPFFKRGLAHGEEFINSLSPDPRLTDLFAYCKVMFEFMEDAVQMLKYFRRDGPKNQNLVYMLVKLNVQLFALYDIYGVPNPSRPRYKRDIRKFSRVLERWWLVYEKLEDKPLMVRSVFEVQYTFAYQRLWELAKHIPAVECLPPKNLFN